jgi:hypothetical protein
VASQGLKKPEKICNRANPRTSSSWTMQPEEEKESPHDPMEDAALAHAIRAWDAGMAEADRLVGRSNAVLALIVAVLAYGIWQGDALANVQPVGLKSAMAGLFGLALVLILAALIVLLLPPHRRRGRSLPGAMLVLDVHRPDWDWTLAQFLAVARRRTEHANLHLTQQNEWTSRRINEAQALFLSAVLCAGAAVLCYVFFADG